MRPSLAPAQELLEPLDERARARLRPVTTHEFGSPVGIDPLDPVVRTGSLHRAAAVLVAHIDLLLSGTPDQEPRYTSGRPGIRPATYLSATLRRDGLCGTARLDDHVCVHLVHEATDDVPRRRRTSVEP